VRPRNGIIEAIGNTPLIRLKRASEKTGCTILGKAEFMNPGQSVKDRAALFIIRDALNSGRLQPGGTVVEGTAGNTGIGLALVGNALGLKTVIVIPETQSEEKKDMLRLAGAKLIEVPAVPYKDPNNYVKYSGRLAEELAAAERRDLGQPVRQCRQPPGTCRDDGARDLERLGRKGRRFHLCGRDRRHACRRVGRAQRAQSRRGDRDRRSFRRRTL
jgi:cysteine synthase